MDPKQSSVPLFFNIFLLFPRSSVLVVSWFFVLYFEVLPWYPNITLICSLPSPFSLWGSHFWPSLRSEKGNRLFFHELTSKHAPPPADWQKPPCFSVQLDLNFASRGGGQGGWRWDGGRFGMAALTGDRGQRLC